ncbi:hypothetical protein ID875_00570 [Streptomyces globisporus]|uniref:Uncharacterized protein n=1 Tax=Streptomyces globisporus TaxID=1908 RepID=A0A927GLW8_STRGL|nr:hypothetical protein [Streptomyces globisporus]
MSDGRGGADDTARLYDAWQELGRAQRRLDAALDRLRDLGADAAHEAAVASIVPRVSRTDAERRLTSGLVTADDLPPTRRARRPATSSPQRSWPPPGSRRTRRPRWRPPSTAPCASRTAGSPTRSSGCAC